MNNNELDKLLKSAGTPEHPEEYWRQFPRKITTKVHWHSQASAQATPRSRQKFKPLLAWGLSLATVCIVVGIMLKPTSHVKTVANLPARDNELEAARKCYQELEAMFPNQVQAIVFDKEGPHIILSDKANIPDSSPLYLKVCGPKGCQGFVTFSGQQIQFNGENCEVLADAGGQVMLVGSQQVWTGDSPTDAVRIKAGLLEVTL
jgi:hypothetical protein